MQHSRRTRGRSHRWRNSYLRGRESSSRECLVVLWLRPHASSAGGTDSVPGWGIKIPHAACRCQKVKEKTTTKSVLDAEGPPSTQLLKFGRFPALPSSHPCQLCLLNHSHIWPLFTPSLEKGMATHSSILAWRIPWAEESDGLQSTGSQRVGHD